MLSSRLLKPSDGYEVKSECVCVGVGMSLKKMGVEEENPGKSTEKD